MAKTFAPLQPNRPELASLERQVAELFVGVLTRWGRAASIAVSHAANKVTKAGRPETIREQFTAAVDKVDFDLTQDELDELEEALQAAAEDSGLRAFAQIGLGAGDAVLSGAVPTSAEVGGAIFDKISERAVQFASENAADLVSGVSDVTKTSVRAAIAEGLAAGERYTDLIARVGAIGAFSADRAALIGETELAMANSHGALTGFFEAKEIGIDVKKVWVTAGGLERRCSVCLSNEAAGPIELSAPFPSGDMTSPAHPRCRCLTTASVDDDAAKISPKGGLIFDHRYDARSHHEPVAKPTDEFVADLRSFAHELRKWARGSNLRKSGNSLMSLARIFESHADSFEYIDRSLKQLNAQRLREEVDALKQGDKYSTRN
jgi:hypothetical protein